MRLIIKNNIKPILNRLGIYNLFYKLYFLCIEYLTYSFNIFLKKIYKTAPILLYHRIAKVSNDPISLCVTPDTFEKHLIFLKKHYDLIPLSELSKRLVEKRLIGNEASITFDDGYQDNILNALPLLEKHNIPATIFITTKLLGQKAAFEWDMQYSENDRASFLSIDEIKKLSNNRLIEVGAHTENHPRLSDLNIEEQKNEILESKLKLEKIIDKKITAFAYPFGGIYDFDKKTINIVKELGFDFAYSNTQSITKETFSKYYISRINIRECDNNQLSKKIFH